MNRSEAIAPLKSGEARFSIECGLLYRNTLRKSALTLMLDCYEETGFLGSSFVFRGPVNRIRHLVNYVKELENNA
jgi:hypothetical protein